MTAAFYCYNNIMPELPEVETVKRGLKKLIIGRYIKSVSSDNPKSFPNPKSDVNRFMAKARVLSVNRRAKVLLIELSTGYSLMVHLKMTGQLVFIEAALADSNRWGAGHPNSSFVGELPDKSTRVIVSFADGSVLYFNDQRKFGWMKLMPTGLILEDPFMKKVGPEPLAASFTNSVFIARLRKRPRTSIKAAILDQSVLAGVGNIYADESLWGARIHPASIVNTLGDKQLACLRKEVVYVLNLSIAKGGSTNRNYVDAQGKKGSYSNFAKVYRRDGQPCSRCGTIITKSRVAGRGTHSCNYCQALAG